MTHEPPRTQYHELFIRTTPAALWAALTRPEYTTRYYFGTAVKTTLEPGTPFAFAMPDGSLASDGTVREVVPEKKLSYDWIIKYDPSLSDETSTVTLELEPRGSVVKLSVTHDLTRAPKTAAHIQKDSWGIILSGCKTLLETGTPLDVPMPGM